MAEFTLCHMCFGMNKTICNKKIANSFSYDIVRLNNFKG
jgi:hypothetical protein